MNKKTIAKLKKAQSLQDGMMSRLCYLYFRVSVYNIDHTDEDADKLFLKSAKSYFKDLAEKIGETNRILRDIILTEDPNGIF
jgi:hypothetical protein